MWDLRKPEGDREACEEPGRGAPVYAGDPGPQLGQGLSRAPLSKSHRNPTQSSSSERNLFTHMTGKPCLLLSLVLSPQPAPCKARLSLGSLVNPQAFSTRGKRKVGVQMAAGMCHPFWSKEAFPFPSSADKIPGTHSP